MDQPTPEAVAVATPEAVAAATAEAVAAACEGSKCVIYAVSEMIDYAGVAIIAVGAALGILLFLRDYVIRREATKEAYDRLRTFLGRSLLLGLEFLVAGDIIKTVAVTPTLDSVIVLAIIVLVRTVLSISIDVEIDGHWPWDGFRFTTSKKTE